MDTVSLVVTARISERLSRKEDHTMLGVRALSTPGPRMKRPPHDNFIFLLLALYKDLTEAQHQSTPSCLHPLTTRILEFFLPLFAVETASKAMQSVTPPPAFLRDYFHEAEKEWYT